MTALQELIEIIKDKRKESEISNTLLRFCQVEAEKLLEKEKEQIIDAFENGEYMVFVKERLDYDHEDYEFNDSEEFYKVKYENTQK